MDRVRRQILRTEPEVDGSGVRILVIDTGVDRKHPDLEHAIDRAAAPSSALEDQHGHGTHVAGIIAGAGTASDGRYRGIAPGAKIIPFRVSRGRSAFGADVARAVEHAIEVNADIINYSGGQRGPGHPPWKWPKLLSFRDRAFVEASERGILCVAAAGNQGPGPGSINRPAALKEVLAVAALTDQLRVHSTSSRGPIYIDPSLEGIAPARLDLEYEKAEELIPPNVLKPDLAAPGGFVEELSPAAMNQARGGVPVVGIASCLSIASTTYLRLDPTQPEKPGYTRIWGTSQSTAVISGLAALVLEYGRRASMDWGTNVGTALAAILREAAKPLREGSEADYGSGMPTWLTARSTVDDCLSNDVRRRHILQGRQLELL